MAKLKDLIEQYGEYEVFETKGDWCDATHITLGLKKPNPKTVWDLEYGDTCFAIFGDGDIDERLYEQVIDSRYIKIGNAFLTKEEAEQDIERRKVETLLIKHGGRRWFKQDAQNHYLWVTETGENLIIGTICDRVQGGIYFDSKDNARKAIDEIGEERIKKALFEVR